MHEGFSGVHLITRSAFCPKWQIYLNGARATTVSVLQLYNYKLRSSSSILQEPIDPYIQFSVLLPPEFLVSRAGSTTVICITHDSQHSSYIKVVEDTGHVRRKISNYKRQAPASSEYSSLQTKRSTTDNYRQATRPYVQAALKAAPVLNIPFLTPPKT